MHHLLGHPSDLRGHLDAHGPLNVALGRNGSWQQSLAASLEASGLTGRGGGAFPTSIKLALARSAGVGGTVVVNAMEGEPASDKDKLLLTRAPHLVLDGAQYLAALCRADRIVVCIPIGRDAVATAVSHAMAERTRHRYARVKEESSGPPTASSPAKNRPWPTGSTPGAHCRCSDRTRARHFASGDARHWCTTPRPWPTSPSSPAMVLNPSGPAG